MRLTKIKVAGFKSFADATSVGFPSNLTGVVGPNGCGKSNIIDAVRWVMGELSAKHLRGDSMTDVIFNGSASRKPVGNASVELVFDNSDGKISGPYADYAEVSLKRQVSRDGSSNYFLNGARCRRKDITQLFLGTGLGSRSYAIIEQGMISRVIEAKADDMRMFVEEAAGISRYKERRKETEARISDTRENLERLQDVRDEVDKQIRHLQRQAATARRYQALKETERRLTAELLALRLREIDSGAEVQDSAVRDCELTMQHALADQRAAEAAIETQRVYQAEQAERVSGVQGRYYEVGAEISRTESSIAHTREMREQQRNELAQARATLAELNSHIERDERQIEQLRAEIAQLGPELTQAQASEGALNEGLAAAENELSAWQQRWEEFNREQGAAHQTTQVERARIEQLENQLRRLSGQSDRLAIEREALMAQESSALLGELTQKESLARSTADELSQALSVALGRSQKLRAEQFAAEGRLESARGDREKRRAEVVSLEALQKAALQRGDSRTAEWLSSAGLAQKPRLAAQLSVHSGWERAVETALGDYLEALCVDELDAVADVLPSLPVGRVSLLQAGEHLEADDSTGMLSSVVAGPAAIVRLLSRVRLAETLPEALRARRELSHDESVITRSGEWIGRDWLRVNRGGDAHSGVLEREQRLKTLRVELARSEEHARETEAALAACREALAQAERERDAAQGRIQGAHRQHADLLGQLEGERARAQESTVRRERLEEEAAEVTREAGMAEDALARARAELDRGLVALDALDSRRIGLESEREERREAVQASRARSQAAQLTSRDLLIRIESRRSSESSMGVGLKRMADQRAQTQSRGTELEAALANGDQPILELESRLRDFLARRIDVENELATERRALEEADASLRALDEKRLDAESRVNNARAAMEQARLVAQESRVRREGIVEQFAATRFDLAEILGGLAADAAIGAWEESLAATRADLEKLGQVNLAAIDELKESSERKEYLDRQFADVTAALTTLEEAMRKIDKETRTRFEDTFNRINAGMQEKFPKLFGGGHAYLELVGEDPLAAGVGVMARPPGKRNSSIHQLSGGEKALTAVALVFSIFDLNPAPFCLLDEVDAPLDEHNVGRFCDIVKEMSERVQFIFITHNKATMELASQLLGVTMTEPGCSRLVSVDVDEAVRMATG
ncbi:MAG TPA: chromosome segregation protein SMC [Steroidobacteraceae bacterium]|nr:chromosome segregation protein SMC [Steroidobacteraceae bacterium]